MSNLDNCPSTNKPGTNAHEKRRRDERNGVGPREVSAATGKAYWRSLDDLVGTREFKDFLQREFPAYASELLDGSRRSFLKIMGASLALAGATTMSGCRRPDHKILPYNSAPEHIIPGKALYYATAMPRPGGGAEGVLATSFEGRPTKLEGNPLHPEVRGKSSLLGQASILGLYDPDRNPAVAAARSAGGITATPWAEFENMARREFGTFDSTNGRGLAFLVQKSTSPARQALKRRIKERWPEARWHVYEPVDRTNNEAGTRIAFDRVLRPDYHVDRAETIVCIDHDLLGRDSSVSAQRGWAASRFRPGRSPEKQASEAQMNRLYVLESNTTLTGGQADHRLGLKPSQITAAVVAIAHHLLGAIGGSRADQLRSQIASVNDRLGGAALLPAGWLEALTEDLVGADRAKLGRSVITVGESQPAQVHALVHALNDLLGDIGADPSSNATATTFYYEPQTSDEAVDSVDSIVDLTRRMRSADVDTLVIIDGNPCYDAPADLDFTRAMEGVRRSIFLGDPNETAEHADVYLPIAHWLESWNDVRTSDGTYSVVQPQIAPLYGGKSDLELLATILGQRSADGYTIVRDVVSSELRIPRTLAGNVTNPAFESAWRRCLHDGILVSTLGNNKPVRPRANLSLVAGTLRSAADRLMPSDGVEAVFVPCPKVHDGRFANNGWLQEVPDQVTKVAWDNPMIIGHNTAERLGLATSRKLGGPTYNKVQVATVRIGEREIDVPIWVVPGTPDDVVVLTLGYGRERGGRIAEGTGVDVYPLRTSESMSVARDVEVSQARGRSPYMVATTQDHWSIEGRALHREVDLYWWKKVGDKAFKKKDAYGNKSTLTPAEKLGILAHAPENEDLYLDPPERRGSSIYYHRVDKSGKPILDEKGNKQRPLNGYDNPVQQWGMSIDLTTCTGCSACVVACQAENNIPIVGKMEVAKGREMHWIRIDRYFASSESDDWAFSDTDMVVQPVTCMHCEKAPCEVVCPVNATVHGHQGTNDMAYNRCIGTRYCSNNCPYKVRRFNYFDYATKKYEGDVYGLPDEATPANENLVPPRFREKIDEVSSMQNNPHVTVRSRGVMEKCTYCMQRINAARVETKLEDLDFVPDGFFQVACQQACPTGAIVFGDIYDNAANGGLGSLVKQAKDDHRTYAMLGYLNVIPRTTYQMRIRNPNHLIRKPAEHNPFEHHGTDYGDERTIEPVDDGHARLSLPILNNASTGAMA